VKVARAQYLELQRSLRREIGLKRSEKNNDKIMDDMLWGIPNGSTLSSRHEIVLPLDFLLHLQFKHKL